MKKIKTLLRLLENENLKKIFITKPEYKEVDVSIKIVPIGDMRVSSYLLLQDKDDEASKPILLKFCAPEGKWWTFKVGSELILFPYPGDERNSDSLNGVFVIKGFAESVDDLRKLKKGKYKLYKGE